MKAANIETADAASAGVASVDPRQQLYETLQGSASNADKAAARALISGMERPWEQLPSRLKSAIRVDASAVLNGTGGMDELLAAGYGRRSAEHILRDLGKRG